MNVEETERNARSLAVLEHRVQHLRRRLARRLRSTRIRRWCYLAAGVLLLLVSGFALFTLTSMTFQLDAHALTQIGRLQVEKNLPQSRADLSSQLRAGAPKFVRQALLSLVDLLPNLRTVLLEDVETRLAAVTVEGERWLRDQAATSVPRTRARLAEQFPDLSEEEQLDELVSLVASDFQRNVEIVLNEIYPKYVAQIDRVHRFLTDLGTVEDSQLTRKERIQKELVQTLLKLMILEETRDQARTRVHETRQF